MQDGILEAATSVAFTTARTAAWARKESINGPVREAWRKLAKTIGDDRKSAVRELRKAIRHAQKRKNEQRLKAIQACRPRATFPLVLNVEGLASYRMTGNNG